MNSKLLRRIFPLIAVSLLAPWPIAFAYDVGATSQKTPQVTVADASVAPRVTLFGEAISEVQSGDLFYINSDQTSDFRVNLYITNAEKLVHNFRYVILNVGVYAKTASGDWTRARLADGSPIADTFITLRNSPVRFSLPGGTSYKVTIDGGSFDCITTKVAAGGSISLQFYLEVE